MSLLAVRVSSHDLVESFFTFQKMAQVTKKSRLYSDSSYIKFIRVYCEEASEIVVSQSRGLTPFKLLVARQYDYRRSQ